MNNNLEGMKTRLQKAEDEISKHTQKIKDKYKIKHSFGINPDTGEILED